MIAWRRRRKLRSREQQPFRLHGDLLTTTLLAFLRNWNAYGYQLAQQLNRGGAAGVRLRDRLSHVAAAREDRAGVVVLGHVGVGAGAADVLADKGRRHLPVGWIDVLGHYQEVLRDALGRMNPEFEQNGAVASDGDDPRAS